MKLLILRNKAVSKNVVTGALNKLFVEYGEANLHYSYDVKDINYNFNWVAYNPTVFDNALGVDTSTLRQMAREIKEEHGDKYDSICIFIDKADWKMGDMGVYGWNLGEFFSGMQIQLIRVSTVRSTFLTVAMEIMHTFDQFVRLELNIDLASIYGVGNFDHDIVHGDKFNYLPWYKKLAPYLNETFQKRRDRFETTKKQLLLIVMLKKLVTLYKTLLLMKTAQPVTDFETYG